MNKKHPEKRLNQCQPLTHAKFQLGWYADINVFSNLGCFLSGDKEAVLCSQPKFSVETLPAILKTTNQQEMNTFTIISLIILYGLTFICFFIPLKLGRKLTGYIVGLTLSFAITFSIIGNLNFLVVFIWLIILIFQVIFISYWTFRAFNRKKTGLIFSLGLTIVFLLFLMQPWISDWTFNKKDVIKILSFHNLELRDEFKILRNEAGGLRDYYETFTLKLSENDFNRISHAIKTSKNYKGLFTNCSDLPRADYKTTETIDFETDNHFEREYWTKIKMENGTFHFRFQLDKQKRELNYTGSDE